MSRRAEPQFRRAALAIAATEVLFSGSVCTGGDPFLIVPCQSFEVPLPHSFLGILSFFPLPFFLAWARFTDDRIA